MIEPIGIEILNDSIWDNLEDLKDYPLSLRIQETERRFLTLCPSPKKPKIKPGVDPLRLKTPHRHGKRRSDFELSFLNLQIRYREILEGNNERCFFNYDWLAWHIYELSGGCIILFGQNPQIGNAYLKAFSLPLNSEIVQRFKTFACHDMPCAAFIWTPKTKLGPERDLRELMIETSFNSACEVGLMP